MDDHFQIKIGIFFGVRLRSCAFRISDFIVPENRKWGSLVVSLIWSVTRSGSWDRTKIFDRTGGAICNVSYWHVWVQDGFNGHRASKLCSNLILMTAPWRLLWSRDVCVCPYPCLVLGINGVPWLTQSSGPGDAGSSPGKSRVGMPNTVYDPTTKLIILRRSPE